MKEYLNDLQITEMPEKMPTRFSIYMAKILLGLTIDVHFFLFAFLDFYLITHCKNHNMSIFVINILYLISTYFEIKSYNIANIDYSSLKYTTYIVDVEKVILTSKTAKIVYKSDSYLFGKSYMLISRNEYDSNPGAYNKKILVSGFWAKNKQNKIINVYAEGAKKYSGYPNLYI